MPGPAFLSSSTFPSSWPPFPALSFPLAPPHSAQAASHENYEWLYTLNVNDFDDKDFEAAMSKISAAQSSQAEAHPYLNDPSLSFINVNHGNSSPLSNHLIQSQAHPHLIDSACLGNRANLISINQQQVVGSAQALHLQQAYPSPGYLHSALTGSFVPQYFNYNRIQQHHAQQQQQQQLPPFSNGTVVQPPPFVAATLPPNSQSTSSKKKIPAPRKPRAQVPRPPRAPKAVPPPNTPINYSDLEGQKQEVPGKFKELPSIIRPVELEGGNKGGSDGMSKKRKAAEEQEVEVGDAAEWSKASQALKEARKAKKARLNNARPTEAAQSVLTYPTPPTPSLSHFTPPRRDLSSSRGSTSSSSVSPLTTVASTSPTSRSANPPSEQIPTLPLPLPLPRTVATSLIPPRTIPSSISLAQLFNTFYFPSFAAFTSRTIMHSFLQELDADGNKTGNVFWTEDLWRYFEANKDVGRMFEFMLQLDQRGERLP
ncbi:hypothetical protein BDY24DRAFT_441028 [Mrakia frigida]|uniref:uncharacterized protein n=1 Tax=Mrakia frigida TaxID=29902 RepID=UPI003FCC1E22